MSAPLITTATTTRTRSGTIRPARAPVLARTSSEPALAPAEEAPVLADDGDEGVTVSDDPLDCLSSRFRENGAPVERCVRRRAGTRPIPMPRAVRKRVAEIATMDIDVGSDESDDPLDCLSSRSRETEAVVGRHVRRRVGAKRMSRAVRAREAEDAAIGVESDESDEEPLSVARDGSRRGL